MNQKSIFIISVLAIMALSLVACSNATPTTAPTPIVVAPSNAPQRSASSSAFETKNNSGGSVDVAVTPQQLDVGQPMAFEIVMNTHSVDLSDDMTQIIILRDDKGKEYNPTAWDGGEPGGHHRSGVIKFAALTSKSKSVDLVIKGLAKVSERTFHWDLP